MKNYDEFEEELKETDKIPAIPAEKAESALLKLRIDLKQASEQWKPSSFEQNTAWTRQETRLTRSPERSSFLFKSVSYVGTATVAVVVTLIFLSWQKESSPQGLPKISEAQPGIYATPFYSEKAKADVIWAEGYEYIPATYTY